MDKSLKYFIIALAVVLFYALFIRTPQSQTYQDQEMGRLIDEVTASYEPSY